MGAAEKKQTTRMCEIADIFKMPFRKKLIQLDHNETQFFVQLI
jgi:hypothetical protein